MKKRANPTQQISSLPLTPLSFQTALLSWYDTTKTPRPWHSRDPYHVWISEIMLQQTQVATVLPYYEQWFQRFPTLESLATAPLDDVLKQWEGLGYYSRARNIHATAQKLIQDHKGIFPHTIDGLLALPGIGPYTANAIGSIVYDLPAGVLDGNVIRVLSRLTDLTTDTTKSATKTYLQNVANQLVSPKRPGDYNQAIMTLGQKICTPQKPQCQSCPINDLCLSRQRGTQHERPVRPPRKRTPHYDVVAGIIYRDDGKFLITQRPLDGMLGGLWEFPGGKVEQGETLSAALTREILEETACQIHATNEILAVVKHAYTHFKITLHALRAQYMEGDIQHIGVIDHRWVDLDEVDHYPFAVTDLKIIRSLKSAST